LPLEIFEMKGLKKQCTFMTSRINTMRYLLPVCVLLLVGCSRQQPADMVINGGTIYTMEASSPTVEAVAVRGDKIVFAGSSADAQELIGDETQVIDLAGKTMTPGLIEGHGHIMGLGYNELNLNLDAVKSYEELVAKVKEAVAKSQPGQWIVGRGWHQDKWDIKPDRMIKGFQTHQLLSDVSPDNPVFLSHGSGHAGFANAKAMQIAGVNQLSLEKLEKDLGEGGEIIRDELGNPTGIFNERAQTLIRRHIPENTQETNEQALDLAMAACARNGITAFHDAGATRESIDLFRKFRGEGRLKSRLYVMITGFDRDLVYESFRKGPEIDSTGWVTIRSVKLNCDGALGSRGAWLLEPYSDRKDFAGMATLPMDTVLKTAREALKAGFQVCSHAIGDRANREVLDRYEIAFREFPEQAKDHRFRIEHAQHLNPNDIPRFASLGVIPSMEAIHLSSDRPWAIDRLGDQRIRDGAYMWQTLLKSGARIVNGTDVPVEPIDPIACFYASVTRKTLKGEPEGGYEGDQKMTREQALRSYTIDAAYGAFQENITGSIAKGKLADFTIFTQDLMKIPEEKILDTQVAMTVVGGKVVFAE
jgi:predicted amidohydrolase YtcJ